MSHHFHQIANLLEKMSSTDKDFRFMATNDLMAELQKDNIILDDDSERKVVRMILKLLEDKNGEVQNLAVKCLGPLVNKVKESQVEIIVDSLCVNMASKTEQLRDISSIGLKTVISELPKSSRSLAANVCQRITGRLSKAIEMEDVSVKLEALDILSELLSRFGDILVKFHQPILSALIPQLTSSRQAVRKRSIIALSYLLILANDMAYNDVIIYLLDGLETPTEPCTVQTHLQCLASICRLSGQRLSPHIDRIMAIIKKYSAENDDELREFCLQACEAFLISCPSTASAHIPMIIQLCLQYLAHDPNYNYGADDFDMEIGTDAEQDEYGDSDAYSDDDDMSWKVRRSAAKCLQVLISTRKELLEDFYENLGLVLISRFKEREESVKSDVFHAYITLLRNTKSLTAVEHTDEMPRSIELLRNQLPDVIKALTPLMRDKSNKTRQDCFILLRELLDILPGSLGSYLAVIIPGIKFSLQDKLSASNMKVDALAFLCALLQTHTGAEFYPHVDLLVPLVTSTVTDSFYKISTEGLLVLQELVKVLKPLDTTQAPVINAELYVSDIYHSAMTKLTATDVDQDVKERAIACMGQIVANMGDLLHSNINFCLALFMERLKNEVTRLSSVKALSMIASSPLYIDLQPILPELLPTLGSFLRKYHRILRLSSLELLSKVVQKYADRWDPPLLSSAIADISPLISDSDLHVAQCSLCLLTTIAHIQPQALKPIKNDILDALMSLVRSPLLQGAALLSVMEIFQALAQTNLPGLDYQTLLKRLMTHFINQNLHSPGILDPLSKQAFHSVAKCIASITKQIPEVHIPLVSDFLADIRKGVPDTQLVFSLLTVGEIGRCFDLSEISTLPQIMTDCFNSSSEDIKTAASYALGAAAVGNLNGYLPLILNGIENQRKHQYLLLHSLKEIISSLSISERGLSVLLPSVPIIWSQLFRLCETLEEGSRNVVSECLGKLVFVNPEELLSSLISALQTDNGELRTVVVSAVRHTISDQPQPIDRLLKKRIGEFLQSLRDPDPSVRKVALVVLNSAIHNKPSLVRDLLPFLLPALYAETKVNRNLIREVEMGPFKHTVDDGLEIRKNAFECMYTLLEQGLDSVEIMQFLDHVQAGLCDHYDIKMLTYLMTIRLAILRPEATILRLDQIIQPLRDTCAQKVKANSVKQEFEKQEELKRSALRAFDALTKIPKASKNSQVSEFCKLIGDNPELKKMFEEIQKDSVVDNSIEAY